MSLLALASASRLITACALYSLSRLRRAACSCKPEACRQPDWPCREGCNCPLWVATELADEEH